MILLSIKPEYVEKIIEGSKKYEFRKKIFNQPSTKIYIYSSSPVQKIIGYFTIEEIIKSTPNSLWRKCNKLSGISKSDFFEYFLGKEKGYAIKIGKVKTFKKPLDPKSIDKNFNPPQSFYYLDESWEKFL